MKRIYFLCAVVLTFLAFAVSLALYPRLPEQIPTHWNTQGEVDDYSRKQFGAFIAPFMSLVMIGLFAILPKLSPKNFEIDSFRETFDKVLLMIVVFLCYIHAVTLWVCMGGTIAINRAIPAGVFLLFAFLGNVLGKVRRNFWIGIRTPWTLASERVWYDTHRFSARVFVIVGVGGFLLVLLGVPSFFALGLILAAVLLTVGYSLFDYKNLQKQGKL